MLTKILASLFIFCPVFAKASWGVCDATLYRIWLEKAGQDEFVRQEKIDYKKFEVQIPKDADPFESYFLDAEIGSFKISAMFESGEASVSNLTISDASHSTDTSGDRLTSFTDFKSMKKVSVYCQYMK